MPGDFWFDSEESLFSFLSCLTERWKIPEGIIVPGFTHETVYEDSDNPGSNRISFRSGGSGAVRNYVITANTEDSFYRLDIGHYVSCYADTDSLVRILDSKTGNEVQGDGLSHFSIARKKHSESMKPKKLRETREMGDKPCIGYVFRLQSESVGREKAGTITVMDWQTGKRTRVSLDSADYSRAIQAHLDGIIVEVSLEDSAKAIAKGHNLRPWQGHLYREGQTDEP